VTIGTFLLQARLRSRKPGGMLAKAS